MVEPLADPDDLESRLGFLGPNQDQWDLDDRLQKATNEMDTLVGTEVEESLKPSVEDQTDFRLAFSNLETVIQVELVSPRGTFDQKVDSSNYTITNEPSRGEPQISFNQSFAEENLFNNDYRLRIIYVPKVFKDLELAIAELDITRLASIQTGDEELKAQAQQAQDRLGNLRDNINKTTANLGDPDAGRNLAANSNFPGDKY